MEAKVIAGGKYEDDEERNEEKRCVKIVINCFIVLLQEDVRFGHPNWSGRSPLICLKLELLTQE